MRHPKVLLPVVFSLILFVTIARGDPAIDPPTSTLLDTYVQTPDPSFQWKSVSSSQTADVLSMTSQTWQGQPWQHQLTIVQPDHIQFPGTALLLINNGDLNYFNALANGTCCTVVSLSGVPNQPLWGLKEDALIAYTFLKFILTGDKTWPLLLPMTKSAIAAMNAVEEYSETTSTPITKFIVGGLSKRGWTTWLAAAEDKRVIGIMPMVYDNLNLAEQMPHQKEMLGDYSSMIGDYTKLNLPDLPITDRVEELVRAVDPYSYLDRLTIPKLVINASNDPYWTVDSLNLYYNELVGPKNNFYIPNAGHLMNTRRDVSDQRYLLGTIENWAHIVASGKTPPAVSLNVVDTADGKHFIASVAGGTGAELWVAKSATKDFRNATWVSSPMKNANGHFEGDVQTPAGGFVAVFAQLNLPGTAAEPMRLSTPMTWWPE